MHKPYARGFFNRKRWPVRVMLVARDVSPSQILDRVQVELQSRGHEVRAVLGHGRPLDDFPGDSIRALVLTSDFVLVGMSSTEKLSKEEIVALKAAMDKGIPYGFVCDIFDCYKRPWFADFRERASKLFVPVANEVAETKALFPNAEVVASGNPCWEDYFDKPSPEEVKALREKYGLSPDRKTILASGGKQLMFNMTFFGGVVGVANANERLAEFNEIAHREKLPRFQVILSVHPGDPNDISVYNPLTHNKEDGLSRIPVVIDKGTKSEKLLSVADVAVAMWSNVGIAAACQRKPAINYFTKLYRNFIEAGGGWPWKPCSELGISELVSDFDGGPRLDEMITWLTNPDSCWSRSMLKKQEEVFPIPPEKGVAVRKICDALEAGMAKK